MTLKKLFGSLFLLLSIGLIAIGWINYDKYKLEITEVQLMEQMKNYNLDNVQVLIENNYLYFQLKKENVHLKFNAKNMKVMNNNLYISQEGIFLINKDLQSFLSKPIFRIENSGFSNYNSLSIGLIKLNDKSISMTLEPIFFKDPLIQILLGLLCFCIFSMIAFKSINPLEPFFWLLAAIVSH